MTTTVDENLLSWLRDAHAMEQQAEQMLKAQAGRIEHYPELKARLESHLQETLGQQQLLEQCIQRLDGSPSVLKDMAGKMAAFAQAAGGMTQSDEVVKGAIAGYVFENLEIACYTSLIAAAREAADGETERVCQQILEQEKAMSAWMLNNLPSVTRSFLGRDATPGEKAKI
jgi:ferritin-like metal-binding protein YciE